MRLSHSCGRAGLGALSLAILLTAACSEPPFAHTNPLDPLYEGTMTLGGGPDTIRTTGDTYTLTLTGEPALDPGKNVRWTSNHPRLVTGGGATFWALPTLRPIVARARATLGNMTAEREFVLLQEVQTITATCTTLSPCDTIDALGQPVELDIGGVDIFNWQLVDVQYAIEEGSVGPRNAAILEPATSGVPARVRLVSRANGATWLLLGLGTYLDSVPMVVWQRAASWTNQCPVTVEVGQSAHLGASSYMDRLGHPFQDGHPTPQLTWSVGQPLDPGAQATVEPTGLVTGVAAGRWYTESRAAGALSDIACVVEVVDP